MNTDTVDVWFRPHILSGQLHGICNVCGAVVADTLVHTEWHQPAATYDDWADEEWREAVQHSIARAYAEDDDDYEPPVIWPDGDLTEDGNG